METETIIDGIKNPESLQIKLRKNGAAVPKSVNVAANKQRMLRYHEYKLRRKEPYFICCANDPVRLEEKCLKFILLGYEPIGGLCFDGKNYMQPLYYHKQGRRTRAKPVHTSSISES